MYIETLVSPSATKIAELRIGVGGKGQGVFFLQWLRENDNPVYPVDGKKQICYHIDQFPTEAEARAYFATCT